MLKILMMGIVIAGLLLIRNLVFSADDYVTITTYYPAPHGVYRDFVTYNNTSLSLKGNAVSIGKQDVTPGVPLKLDVNGTIKICQPNTTPKQCGILQVYCNNATNTCYAVYAD